MYAIMQTGGKQYKVEPGNRVEVEKLDLNAGDTVELDVLMVVDGKKVSTGKPFIKNTKVVAKVLKHGKQAKITVFKYKPKKRVRTKKGHRQLFTLLEILEIKKA